MPEPAPVTTAIWSWRRVMGVSLCSLSFWYPKGDVPQRNRPQHPRLRDKLIQIGGIGNGKLYRRVVWVRRGVAHGYTALRMENRCRSDLVGGSTRLSRSRAPCGRYGRLKPGHDPAPGGHAGVADPAQRVG